MSRLASQSIAAPAGMDLTTDPVAMDLGRARNLVNFQIDRGGLVKANVRFVNQLPSGQAHAIDGVGYYYQASIRNNQTTGLTLTDLIVFATSGFLFVCIPSTDPVNFPASLPSFVVGGITGYCAGQVFSGKRVRFLTLADEMVMVQEGGLIPLRYYSSALHGTGFYRAGFEPPLSTGAYTNLTLATSGVGLTGTWSYKITWEDERGRESSPTPALAIALVNQGTLATWSTIYGPAAYGGSNLVFANLYRNTLGSPSVFYRVQRATIGTATSGNFTVDNAADSAITSGGLCPGPGENDPPAPASIGCVWNNRVVLDDVTNPNNLQISNLLSATQFTSVPIAPPVATDGLQASVGTDYGDKLSALVSFGAYLAIFKRRSCFFLSGDGIANFSIQPVYQRGCVAPDSAVRCDNVVVFLSDDGVYQAGYQGGEALQKISKDIEAVLFKPFSAAAAAITPAQREAAHAQYLDRKYYLFVGQAIFVYDFDRLAWTTIQAGSGAYAAGPGIPRVTVNAGIGFDALPNSATEGSIVPLAAECNPVTPGGAACSVTLSPTTLALGGGAVSANVTVTATNFATIPHATDSTWLHVSGPSSGSGTATISADLNTTCFSRVGVVFICNKTVTVTQDRNAGCTCSMVSLTPSAFTVAFGGATVQTAYVETDAQAITYSTSASWLHPQAPVPGAGFTGTMNIVVDANGSCATRVGTVQICDKFVTITQTADPGCACSCTVDPPSIGDPPGSGGTYFVQVTAANSATNTPVSSDQSWIHIVSYPASGSGQMTITVDPYSPVGPCRTGHVTICNAVVLIMQGPCGTPP